jgi:hypothetical protein
MNKEIKKGNLNYDQSGRAYPDNPEIKENWDCIWEKDGKHYKLVGDDEHKEWEEIELNPKKSVMERFGKLIINNKILYAEIEYLIIQWSNDGTKTAGSLTRDIMKLIENKEAYSIPLYENGIKTEWTIDGIVGDEKYKELIKMTPEGKLPDLINVNLNKNSNEN